MHVYAHTNTDITIERKREIDPLIYFSFQPVFHVWCNKGRYRCYPVIGMAHIKKKTLLIIEKISPCSSGSGFPL